MARLIDADVLLGKLSSIVDYCRKNLKVNGLAAMFEVLDAIIDCKTVDAVEVVHGHWYVSEYEYLNCSVCGEKMYTGCNSTKEAQLLKEHLFKSR